MTKARPDLEAMRKRRLAMIHTAKKTLGLDDTVYRDLLERVAGQRSAAGLDLDQLKAVVEELRRLGFKAAPRRELATAQQRKIAVLWANLAESGQLRDRSARALDRFVERMTGVSALRWLKDPDDCAKVIEALKAWARRA